MTLDARRSRIQIAPSILAADFLHLAEAIQAAQNGGADRLHIDVMDGRFVPNISIGLPVVEAIREATAMTLEAHLMIVEPERYIEHFAAAGADIIIVHAEVSPHLYRTLQHIRALGKRSGVAINPGTPWLAIQEVLAIADVVLVMTVNPGFGGQSFLTSVVPKLRRASEEINRAQLAVEIEVDGGITAETASVVASAGADVLVAGTSVFRARQDVAGAICELRHAAEQAQSGVSQVREVREERANA